MTDSTEQPTERNVLHRIIQMNSSPDGRRCDIKIPTGGPEPTGGCHRPAVVRVSYRAWWPPDRLWPEDLPDRSTMFVGACEEHLEDLRAAAASRGAELEVLGPA